jgi:outer membrane protein OmpA-like peptidoglycan-associated protein
VSFTRNNFKEGDFARDSSGVSRLMIFRSFLSNGFWSTPEELPFSSDDYSVAHPSLNEDGSRLYFASDMPGSMGNSDIFYVDILGDSTYGNPINLGPQINTEARETFPFISASGLLYFSSDGHPGLGGLDIYAAKRLEDGSIKVLNVGKPINSEMDDFALIINEEDRSGYFTSNRQGGQGSDDIYGFRENKPLDFSCMTKISGWAMNKENGKKINGATIQLIGANDNILDEVRTDNEGNFSFDADCREISIKLLVKKEEYLNETLMLNLEGVPELSDVSVEMTPSPMAVPLGTELGSFLRVQRLKFDFGKTYIRPDAAIQLNKLYIYLRDFPQINIEIRQYTDSRGSSSTNLVLSRRRAKSIKDYLIATGIDKNRITIKGMGESDLINHCANGVQCSEKEHQENNRSEFIVIN